MGVQIDKARREDQSRAVHAFLPFAHDARGNAADDSAFHQNVRLPQAARAGVHAAAGIHPAAHQPSTARRTAAMRTNTPFSTWRKMRDFSHSTTSSAISTPRLKGAGCRMMAFFFIRFTRAAVRP